MLVDMEQDINLQGRLINNMRNKIRQIDSKQIKNYKELTPPLEEVENSIAVSIIGPVFLFFLGFIFILSGSPGVIVGIFLVVIGIIIFVVERSGDIDKNEKAKVQWEKYKQEKAEYLKSIAYEENQGKEDFIL